MLTSGEANLVQSMSALEVDVTTERALRELFFDLLTAFVSAYWIERALQHYESHSRTHYEYDL
jgi:hypothetical protein